MPNWITIKTDLNPDIEPVKSYLFREYTLDSQGKKRDETEYDCESNVIYHKKFSYFDTGELQEFTQYDASNNLVEKQLYLKNNLGRIESIQKLKNGKKSSIDFTFNNAGINEKRTMRDENGQIINTEIYLLNEKGKLAETKILDGEGNEISRRENTYFSNGMLASIKQFKDETMQFIELYEYDEKHTLIKKTHFKHGENSEIIDIYQYDSASNMVYHSTHQNGAPVFKNTRSFDRNNNLIFEAFFALDYPTRAIVQHEEFIHKLKA